MVDNKDNVIKQIRGKAFYAKILGSPVPNFNRDGYEWLVDVSLDKKSEALMKSLGLGPKVKAANEKHDNLPYITFRRNATKKMTGEKNNPIRVVGPDGKTEWDRSTLIGNGSVVNVKFAVHEVTGGPQKKTFIRADILSMQVFEHIPYVAPERAPEYEANPEADIPQDKAVGENW